MGIPVRAFMLAMAFFGAAPVCHAQHCTVTGAGNVCVGAMNGGKIEMGLTTQQIHAIVKATRQDQVQIVGNAVRKAMAERRDIIPGTETLSKAVIGEFLARAKRKNVPEADWGRTLDELANQFLELGSRIAATPVTSDKIKSLVDRADEARKTGRFDDANVFLEQATELALQDADRIVEQAKVSNRQVASLLASRAGFAFLQLNRREGAELLERAAARLERDPSSASLWWLFEAGDAWIALGQSDRAMRAYADARRIATTQAAADPTNTEWRRDLSVSHSKIGDVLVARGDLAGALSAYEAGLAIRRGLSVADPTNTGWRRDLSVSHIKVGDVLVARGDLAGALSAYEAGLAIHRGLSAADPTNTEWRRDLSVALTAIAQIHEKQGAKVVALPFAQESLRIDSALAELDPSNATWKNDVIVSRRLVERLQR